MTATWFSAPAPVARRVRAFLAPVNRATQMPVLFDPSEQGRFSFDAPPAPWLSLGWVQDFVRKTASKSTPLMTGIPAATLEQVRESLEAEVSLQFLSWTKLTMALATGSQHMNILAPAIGAAPAADGAQAAPAVTPQTGSTSTSIPLALADAAKFTPGAIVAVDVDYMGQTGYVGCAGGRRVRATGAHGCGLCAACDFQRRTGVAGNCEWTDIGRAIAGRRARDGRQGAGGHRICGSGRRKLLSGMVGALRDGRQPGRKNLLSLSEIADDDGSGGIDIAAQSKESERTFPRSAQGAVSGIAGHGPIGWGASGLLPELPARGKRIDLMRDEEFKYPRQRDAMKITIQGQDYTAAFDAVRPLTIERKLNEPSDMRVMPKLCLSGGGLAAPVRFQSLAVTGDDGTTYFTGYIAVSPLPEYAGMGIDGPRYRTCNPGCKR